MQVGNYSPIVYIIYICILVCHVPQYYHITILSELQLKQVISYSRLRKSLHPIIERAVYTTLYVYCIHMPIPDTQLPSTEAAYVYSAGPIVGIPSLDVQCIHMPIPDTQLPSTESAYVYSVGSMVNFHFINIYFCIFHEASEKYKKPTLNTSY